MYIVQGTKRELSCVHIVTVWLGRFVSLFNSQARASLKLKPKKNLLQNDLYIIFK